MRHIPRRPLDKRVSSYLARWTAHVERAPDSEQKTTADARWKAARGTKAMRGVQATLEEMNGPLGTHCMYCEYNEAEVIDHFEPRVDAPRLTFVWSNLHLSCDVCNRRKREQFLEPVTRARPLSPCEDRPPVHLELLPSGAIAHRTARGDWTVRLLGLMRSALVEGRRDKWLVLRILVPEYARLRREGDDDADDYAQAILRGRFRSVLRELVSAARSPDGDDLGLTAVAAALEARPEITEWAGLAP